ncbi:MAG: hypothetical protein JWO08_2116 [Verrucomicrobiaceae bacterium]|nr:hypothetical protein [Verrucomicrobiaceae bacterium]
MSSNLQPEDDFSFLPTVDDAEAIDREALWAKAKGREVTPAAPVQEEVISEAEPESVAAPAPWPEKKAPRIRLKVKPISKPPPPPPQEIKVELDPPKPEAPKAEEPEKTQEIVKKIEASGNAEPPAKPEEIDHRTVIRPPGAEEKHKEEAPLLTPKEKWHMYWIMIGGQSLAFSVLLHLAILTVAALIVIRNVSEQHVDFMPGGGTSQGEAAERSLAETVKQKRTPWMKRNPTQRVASNSLVSDIKLPETPMEMMALPDISKKADSMGFGNAGAGGGFGSGIGTGGKSGVTFQPIMMFGKNINAKRMAVILDVSSSMTSYLDDVVKEVDRVAKGSPVICYFGCGLMRPEKGGHIQDKADLCKNPSFERFWRVWYGPSPFNATPSEIAKIKFDPKERIPLEEVYRPLAKRPGTYFVDYNGIVYAWTALVNDLVRNADALYWFSDFMDDVEDKEIQIVLENLKRRKQRLYIQPSIHGSSFEKIVSGLVIPTGGDVIEPPPMK